MKTLLDEMIGHKYGRLTVIADGGMDKYHHRKLICKCDCGNITTVFQQSIRSGVQISCGCFMREQVSGEKPRLQNEYDLSGEYGVGYTHNTHNPFYFDLEDFDKIKQYCWREDSQGYIITNSVHRKTLLMHRLVMNVDDNLHVDHIQHQVNDNRKNQLRVLQPNNNICNAGLRSNNTSGHTGVSFNKNVGKWEAYITYQKRRMRLGLFMNIEDAIIARETAEEKYFGEYSFKNSMNT